VAPVDEDYDYDDEAAAAEDASDPYLDDSSSESGAAAAAAPPPAQDAEEAGLGEACAAFVQRTPTLRLLSLPWLSAASLTPLLAALPRCALRTLQLSVHGGLSAAWARAELLPALQARPLACDVRGADAQRPAFLDGDGHDQLARAFQRLKCAAAEAAEDAQREEDAEQPAWRDWRRRCWQPPATYDDEPEPNYSSCGFGTTADGE
jgi:hypothetical protein